MANSFEQYRMAGAIARQMLAEAAANSWNVPPSEISIAAGRISHASGLTGAFGDFAEAASRLAVPTTAPLKDASKFTFIGKTFKRLDTEQR
jgi:isoquinoline 1-oxidoreductase subunit beta